MFSGKKQKPANLRSVIAALLWVSVLPVPAVAGPDDAARSEALGTFVSASGEAVSQFGEVGETLVNLQRGDFAFAPGTGSTKRALARRWNTALEPFRAASKATRTSLPYKAAPWLFLAADAPVSVLAPLMEGDMKGAAAGAVSIGGGTAATTIGSTLLGSVGTGVGGVVGSFFPVIGSAAGSMVGGAVGNIAGGFLASAGYEIYVKGSVVDAVEGAIASMFDPFTQAVLARQRYLRRSTDQLYQYWDKLHETSADFDIGSVELIPATEAWQPVRPAPDRPQQVVLVPVATSFDAIVAGMTTTMSDGAVYENTAGELAAQEVAPECKVTSFRDGYFFNECEWHEDYPYPENTVHIDGLSTMMGVVENNQIHGWWLFQSRNFDVNSKDRDEGEYLRSYTVAEITGRIGADGQINLSMQVVADQIWDMETVPKDGYLSKTGTWLARDMVANTYPVQMESNLKIAGTDVEGSLMLPQITAEYIAGRLAEGFALDPVFFQHGARPPPY